MPDAIDPQPTPEVPDLPIVAPDGFVWSNHENGRTAPAVPPSILVAYADVVELVPLIEGLTFERIPPRSKYRQR